MLGVVNSIVNFIFFIKIRQITSIPCGSKAQPCLTFFLKIRQENVNAYNMLHDNNCLSNFLSNFFQKTKFFRQNTKIKKFFTNFFGVKWIKKSDLFNRIKILFYLTITLLINMSSWPLRTILSFNIKWLLLLDNSARRDW